jgi:hypothetical protein
MAAVHNSISQYASHQQSHSEEQVERHEKDFSDKLETQANPFNHSFEDSNAIKRPSHAEC